MGESERPSDQFLAAGKMENCFRDAGDLLERYIVEGTVRSEKTADIASTHLVARSLADVRWGQHLASSGYPIQMYSVIRPVSESINLINLFVQEPALADEWAAGESRKFQPAEVRKRLGIEKDEVYSWMSEHSHPRFAGFQLTTYQVIREGEEKGRGLMKLGELPFELPAVLLATTMPGLALMSLAEAAGHLVVKKEVALRWPTLVRRVGEMLRPGFEAVYAALDPASLKEDEAGAKLLEALDEAVAHAREMEAIVEDAHAHQSQSRR